MVPSLRTPSATKPRKSVRFVIARAAGVKPGFNVEVSFTADEETDSALGTGWIASHGRLQADYAVVGEGGEGDEIGCGHIGVVWLNVRVHGRAAHGSTPEAGINALEKMSALVLALEVHKRQLAARSVALRGPAAVTCCPLIVHARWNSPRAAGIAISVAIFAPPPDCPNTVTQPGSPPISRAWSRTHSSASTRSRRPAFPEAA